MISPEEKQKILNSSSKSFPLGSFYYIKVYNKVFPVPYFFWVITPVVAIIITSLNSYLFNHALNLKITAFSTKLAGYVDNNILLVHDIFTLGILLTTIFVVCLIPFELFHKDEFDSDMRKIAKWYRVQDLPHKDRQFLNKMYIGALAYLLAIELVFWIIYPEPSFQSFRMKIASNVYYYLVFISFLYFSCLFALSSIITFYGVKRYVV